MRDICDRFRILFRKAGSDYISADFCGGMFENSDRPCYKLWGDV